MLPPSPEVQPKTFERNAAATRRRLLDAAEREFAARGFAGARLRDIAFTAGVQPALIHHYFEDKSGLYRAVLDRALSETTAESLDLLGRNLALDDLVRGLVELLVRFYAAHASLLAIFRHEAVSGGAVLGDVLRERSRPVVQAVAAVVEERQRAGEIRSDVGAAELILAAMSVAVYPFVDAGVLGAILPEAVPADAAALERRTSALVTLLLSAVRPTAFSQVRVLR